MNDILTRFNEKCKELNASVDELIPHYESIIKHLESSLSETYTIQYHENNGVLEQIGIRFKPHSDLPYIVKMRIELLCAQMFPDNKFM